VFTAPPAFEHLGGGLVSTVRDVLRFLRDGRWRPVGADGGLGRAADRRRATPAGAADRRLPPGVSARPSPSRRPGHGWRRAAGGWNGGAGATGLVDPARGPGGVLLTQRAMTGPLDGFGGFWTAVAAPA